MISWIVFSKKSRRYNLGLCPNCGKPRGTITEMVWFYRKPHQITRKLCACKIPKKLSRKMPLGIRRRPRI